MLKGNPVAVEGLSPGDDAQLVAVDGREICEWRREEDDEVDVAIEVATENTDGLLSADVGG